ncbi:hypothetical protein DBIPINDM_000192 [Mesorhizobium sp. AR02]|uniref:hypothetical protein n=1 Tax=Mesorhizobium sp. AR02 TaxID=2865837 RepID=UPI00215FF425|nr:hypothetical protein [Mesorhizobium sp. AR02]UVK53842.1 hypothetical protein DBIPINDM_000192 [Mesorhizobium sp. AR02]
MMKAFQDRTLTDAADGIFLCSDDFCRAFAATDIAPEKEKPRIAGAFLTIDHFAFS